MFIVTEYAALRLELIFYHLLIKKRKKIKKKTVKLNKF